MTKRLQINIDVTEKEKAKILDNSRVYGFRSVSEYIRFVALNAKIGVNSNDK